MIDSRCGLHCTGCEFKDSCGCGGCIETSGHPFHGECPVAVCCQNRGLTHCGECPDIPCELLMQYSCDPEHGDNPCGARIEQCRRWAAGGDFEFLDTNFLRNDELMLILEKAVPADPVKKWVPAYHFGIFSPDGNRMGKIDLRIGYDEKLFYGGHIGYTVDEPYRGHRYAAKACKMLFELAKKHGMEYLYITCVPENSASYRTCELAGGQFLGVYQLPEDNNMRTEEGKTEVCVFKFEM